MMSKAPDTGIASARGDCHENVALPSTQAKVSIQQTQYEGNTRISPSVSDLKLDQTPNYFCPDKYLQGDKPQKYLENACICCKRQFERPTEPRKPTRVMYWEIPRPKFGGISVTADDYRVHNLPKREVPPWHPHRTQPWFQLEVPSVTETTYKKDFGPPVSAWKVRKLPLRSRTINIQGSSNEKGKFP